jgi:hypothetical protein
MANHHGRDKFFAQRTEGFFASYNSGNNQVIFKDYIHTSVIQARRIPPLPQLAAATRNRIGMDKRERGDIRVQVSAGKRGRVYGWWHVRNID